METSELQQKLFTHLKDHLPPHISLVNDLCDLLDLSADSVYRRIRGEKPITLNELKRICEHYNFSLDQLLQLKNESILFRAPGLNEEVKDFKEYLNMMLQQVRYFNSFKYRQMKYLCKDIPFWYFFLFPEIAAFKSFFWIKTIINDPALSNKKFSLEEFSYPEYFLIGQQIIEEYNNLPSEELWNLESINSTINQIAYYRDAGLFADKKNETCVVDSFQRLLDHLQEQTSCGQKFIPGATSLTYRSSIKFYINELILGSNTILLELDNQYVTTITHSVLNYLITSDERFTKKNFNTFNVLLSRSSLISNTGEKERNRFFNALRDKVDCLRK